MKLIELFIGKEDYNRQIAFRLLLLGFGIELVVSRFLYDDRISVYWPLHGRAGWYFARKKP